MSCCKCCCEKKNPAGKCCGPPGSSQCCESPRVCCGPNGNYESATATCCQEGETCCNGDCCGVGYHCCGNVNCCEEQFACCGEYCCDTGECCENGVCVSCDCDPVCSTDSCEQCVDQECVSTCTGSQVCCEGACEDACCCCIGDDILGFPLIDSPAAPCDETLLKDLGNGCENGSITVEWCGVEVTYNSGDDYYPGNGTIKLTIGYPEGSSVNTLLALEELPGPDGFVNASCGFYCIWKSSVSVAQYPEVWSSCFNNPRRGKIVFREGCDLEPQFVVTEEGELCDCTEDEPTITVTFAP